MPFSSLYNLYFSPERKFVQSLNNILGFVPSNLALYRLAFRHKSKSLTVKKGTKSSNERLEFLGDAVLGAVIAEILFKMYPYKEEGFLTEMRSKIVSRVNLNQLARKLGFDKLIDFDSRSINIAPKHSSLLGDAFESLIGAIYLDKGYNFTKNFLDQRIVKPHIDILTLELTETNFKSKLIEWGQRQNKEIQFEPINNAQGENEKLFTVQVLVNGEIITQALDYSKKNAEKLAAEKACLQLAI
ncbi:MAG: ribonuclease III [Sphingobacteriales bacterium]|nr:MAG: ribonuclease III [Sphingobacteriales bacterium]TAF79436.1 MAG: ribonuclease III [Sphingobacteriales bacterium]